MNSHANTAIHCGFCVGLTGALLNLLCAVRNGGRMPVITSVSGYMSDKWHVVNPSSITWRWACDIWPLGNAARFSVGDALLMVGLLVSLLALGLLWSRKIIRKLAVPNGRSSDQTRPRESTSAVM